MRKMLGTKRVIVLVIGVMKNDNVWGWKEKIASPAEMNEGASF